MVIFDDLRKLLLYQRLNLGFECEVCKRRFYNRLEHLVHVGNCKRAQLKCEKCGKTFGHQKILQLHMQFHNLSDVRTLSDENKQTTECINISNTDKEGEPTNSALDDQSKTSCNKTEPSKSLSIATETVQEQSRSTFSHTEVPKKQPSQVVRVRRRVVPKRRVGLTKVRMEDCLRCDACSCIYIDHKDYYKHMRNFHQVDVNNAPIPQPKPKKSCRSCCKQCRGVHCRGEVKRPRASQPGSNLIFRINMRDNIKNRWSEVVSQQLSECSPPEHVPEVNIKPDPDAVTVKPDPDAVTVKPDPDFNSIDLSHLLSQVEVKIKIEPPDDFLA